MANRTVSRKLAWAFAGVALAVTVGVLAQAYNIFYPGGALSGSWNSQTVNLGTGAFISGQMPLTNIASIATNTALGNYSGSTQAPVALNPLAIANMQAAVISADVITSSNITLSGSQAVDGITVGNGQTVLVASQTTGSQNGIYISSTGAWTRAANFPSGYVISQNCDLLVQIRQGTTFEGTTWNLDTSSAALTIGTSSLNFSQTIEQATPTTFGLVKITTTGDKAAGWQGSPTPAIGDCTSFQNTTGSITDFGNISGTTGGCVTSDANGHFILDENTPTVTGSGCSLTSGGQDTSGSIVATGIDTCTLTFGLTWVDSTPVCTVAGVGATVIPYLNALPSKTSAVFKTTAAGTFTYHCL